VQLGRRGGFAQAARRAAARSRVVRQPGIQHLGGVGRRDRCGGASERVGSRKGRLAPGFDADILAVAGDLTTDVRALLDVRAVFRAGRRV
jgi:hypothetical protein